MNSNHHLYPLQKRIEGWARDYGLDFFDLIFEVVDYRKMNEVAAYGGFPVRYPHWRFGMAFEKMFKSHTYGLSMIYELVINNDPAYAYLLEGNSLVIQKMVMAHVMAHVDFFKNNFFFSSTNRKMVDEMANHAVRVRRFMERHGVDEVESFIDTCLSLENLIDIHGPYRGGGGESAQQESVPDRAEQPSMRAEPRYLRSFLEQPEPTESPYKDQSVQEEEAEPEGDLLAFLLRHAPLKPWQRNVLEIVRDEAYYFAPQMMTKIMNEGWATYWHTKIMTERALVDSELVDYADVTSGVTASSGVQLNPYRLGVALFEDIEDRWNKGRFGKEWEDCSDWSVRASWDHKLGLGLEKIFEVRRFYNDITFIDDFFTEDFCRRHKFFNFGYNAKHDRWEIESRRFGEIKERLLGMLTNAGNPRIVVLDGNYHNRGELLLEHLFEGTELKLDEAQATLENLVRIWNRPVHLRTVIQEREAVLSYDGHSHQEQAI